MTTNSKRQDRSVRYCTPNCQFFRCSKRAMGPKRKVRGRLKISCNFVEGDMCTGSRCTYSFCNKHKQLPNGQCGLREHTKVKPDERKVEEKLEKELIDKDKRDNRFQSMMKDKYRKKLKVKGKKW